MTDIIIVNDGQYRWGADRAELLGWMNSNGWAISGSSVTEPETERNDDGDLVGEAPYDKMCQEIQPLAGYEPGLVCREWDDLPSLTAWPSDGPRAWWLSGVDGEG